MMRKALLALPVAAVLLGGCSVQVAVPPLIRPSSPPAAARSLSSELLTAADMPAGWATSRPSAPASGTSTCAALDGSAWQHLPREASVTFAHDGAEVTEVLAAGTVAQASTSFAAARAAAEGCPSFTVTSATGVDRYRLTPVAIPVYGDQSCAFTMVITGPGGTVSGAIVLARTGGTLVQIITTGPEDVPLSVVEQITTTAVDRTK